MYLKNVYKLSYSIKGYYNCFKKCVSWHVLFSLANLPVRLVVPKVTLE